MNSNDTGYLEIELKRIERDRSVWLKKYFNMLDLISDKKKEYSRKIIFIMLLIGLFKKRRVERNKRETIK